MLKNLMELGIQGGNEMAGRSRKSTRLECNFCKNWSRGQCKIFYDYKPVLTDAHGVCRAFNDIEADEDVSNRKSCARTVRSAEN